MTGWFKRRILQPVLDLLRQGISPEKIALSIGWGIALGVFPVLGSTTLLCTLAAVLLRLNLPAIQLVNWLVYPLQIALLIPFFRLGEKLFRAPPLEITPSALLEMFRTDFWGSIASLWDTTWHAVVAWVIVGPAFVYLLSLVLTPLLRRANLRVGTVRPSRPRTAGSSM